MTLNDRILAFALHACQLVMDADGEFDIREAEFLSNEFPEDALRTAGFIDDNDQLTDQYDVAVATALETLPEALDDAAKLELIDRLFRASMADNHFEHREGNILLVASRLLGLPAHAIDSYLTDHKDVGEVELDDAE